MLPDGDRREVSSETMPARETDSGVPGVLAVAPPVLRGAQLWRHRHSGQVMR